MRLLIILLFPLVGYGQSFPELIAQYEKDCSQIVNDTIEQTGTISYEIIPVYDQVGKLAHYAYGKADTVWDEPECGVFKFLNYSTWLKGVVLWNQGITLTDNSYPIYSTERQATTKVRITRKYVCQVKQREVEPFSEHFWEWLKAR